MGGFCGGHSNPEEVNAGSQGTKKSADFEKQLDQFKKTNKSIKKLLLLGPGNSGKSTFFKQLITIHGTGFTEKQVKDAAKSIFDCVISQMTLIIYQCQDLGFQLPPNIAQTANYMLRLPRDTDFTQEIAQNIEILWNNELIKKAFELRANEGIVDSCPHFFNNIRRISRDDFVPTTDDILLVRTPTTGVAHCTIVIEGHQYLIFDAGGQRSERSKWIHTFDTVTAVLFVASLSCYDQRLYEMEHVNAMHESLELFDEICNSRWFRLTSIILFLNKSDLFAEKIQHRDLTICFPEFPGPNTVEASISYIQWKFYQCNNNSESKQIYVHVTCATNRANVQDVFSDVQHIVINASLHRGGLL